MNGYLRKMLLECSLKVGSGNRGKTLSAVPEVFAWRSSGVDKWGVEAAEHKSGGRFSIVPTPMSTCDTANAA